MLRSLYIAAFCAILSGPVMANPMIMDPYARSSGPTARAGAAFFMIHGGETADRLLDARSEAAKRVELHTHIMTQDGLAKMVRLKDGIEIPAGGMVRLERGGMHVMFMGLTAPFEQGMPITVTLVFEHAGEIEVQIPVDQERRPAVSNASHDH
ncbi:MAG: copper chaperone PCu(A)C [Pseudoprimorskyibacter sp.]|nr:copper chaperone PCu(A)C [Pseudoprimorskyibacter sp.]